MKLVGHMFLIVGVVTLVGLLACSPKTTAPAPPTTPTSIQPTPVLPASQTSTPEDTAWNKTVEAARKEGKLNIYSYNFVGDVGIAIAKAFSQRYSIQVDIITGRGAEFLERVKTEKRMGRLVADMTEGSALHIKNMKKEGLTISLASELPVLREKDVWVADIFGIDPQDRHIMAFNFSTYTPYINTKIVKPGEEPKVWKDFLNPKWKGRMVLTDPLTSGGPYQLFVPLMREKLIDVEFIKDLYKQDLRFASALPDEGSILSRGERPLSIRGVDIVYSRFISEGAPIKAIAIDDGTVMSAVTTTAFDGAPHPNATKVFINWFLSPEGQTVYGKGASVASARKDVKNFLPEAAQITPKRPVILTDEDNNQATALFRERYLEKLWGR